MYKSNGTVAISVGDKVISTVDLNNKLQNTFLIVVASGRMIQRAVALISKCRCSLSILSSILFPQQICHFPGIFIHIVNKLRTIDTNNKFKLRSEIATFR